jgi:hypothetical protein
MLPTTAPWERPARFWDTLDVTDFEELEEVTEPAFCPRQGESLSIVAAGRCAPSQRHRAFDGSQGKDGVAAMDR